MPAADQPNRRLAMRRELRGVPSRIEDKLWAALCNRRFRGLKFRRQHSIGPYVADFFCDELQLVVEADRPVHHGTEQQVHDARRDRWLKEHGLTVVRLPQDEIINAMPLALARIERAAAACERRRASPSSDLR